MKKNVLSVIFTIILFVITVLCITGCSGTSSGSPLHENNENRAVPVNVRANFAEYSTFTETLRLLGVTQANSDLTYSAEVAGRLEYLAVDYGDKVVRGQILARVDYEMLTAQAQQAQAAFDLAEKTFERLETLRKDGLVTQQRIDEAQAGLIQAEAQLRQTRTVLRHSEVRSTINGVVAGRFAQQGEYIMPGSPLLRVIDYSEIIVTGQVPETRIADIRPGLHVSVYIDALRDTFSGSVDVVLPNADPESRTFTIRVRTSNDSGRILVGMASTLNIDIKEHVDVIVISQDVVIEHSNSRYVFVVRDNTARKTLVETGPSERHSVVVTSGLSSGDAVITEGHRDLVDGQPVQVVP